MDDRMLSLKKGNPRVLGVTEGGGGYDLVRAVPKGSEASLLFYEKGAAEPWQEIPLTDQYRIGGLLAVHVTGLDPKRDEYNYRIDGQVAPDPCAPLLRGCGGFGELPDPQAPHQIRCGLFPSGDDAWEETEPLATPYEDTIIYKVHVRGYTMHRNSKVRRKGTFAGLAEKIPYLKELGITALELMPAYEFQEIMLPQEMPLAYAYKMKERFPLNFWGYTRGFYFAPKSAYSYSIDPIQEFRGLVRALHAAGIECIMEFYFPETCDPLLVLCAVRHWKLNYHIDGFHLVGPGVPGGLLAFDPLLSHTKLISEGGGPGENLAEYNAGFKVDMRRWLKSDEGSMGNALARMRRNPKDHAVINHMADQNGFTLQDMVCYEKKHNEANREDNQDGSDYDHSWNCGVEGPTRRRSVRMLRDRQVKNAVLMLMLSQGVPLLYGGDEFGNSQQGNNNAYCQDNEIGWVDWGRAKRFRELTDFVREVIAFRKEHKVLHLAQEPQGVDYRCLGYPDISYHGQRAWYGDTEPSSRQAGIMYYEGYGQDEKAQGFIYLACNLYWEPQRLALPNIPEEMRWRAVLGTCGGEEQDAPQFEEDYVLVPARTILVLAAGEEDVLQGGGGHASLEAFEDDHTA